MNAQERYELITRNAEEVVTDEEAHEIADDPQGKRAYVGYEPSGVLHIGHMLTANKLIDLQDAGMEVVVLLADVHAYLNGKGSFDGIQETAERMREGFVAFGLDEDRTEFVLGSEFQLDDDYTLDVQSLAVRVTLNRARRSMSEVAREEENPNVGQIWYPLMQAVDIARLDIDLAVGGIDQRKIHMLARDHLPDIGYEAPTALHTPILTSLEGGDDKMSSSEGDPVAMDDSREDIRDKILDAYCPPGTDGNPVAEIYRYHIFPRFEKVVVERPEKYGGDLEYMSYEGLANDLDSGELHPQDAKEALVGYVDGLVEEGREKI
ncbi:tyrosine--tRNA ligase [Haladaptatus sp. F3-133]|uniref:Tyrosine--tRNA ligase n=1 Tax=Halorutilus salinus TaxID=2487751 RepID=A0A9Q4C4L5_9EURY|nr:tyrosine--tRNA ligase [Halorutilus salinus]